jgi:hypothetical protein
VVIKNALPVLIGKKTWIGFSSPNPPHSYPTLKPSVYPFGKGTRQAAPMANLDAYYARNFSIRTEVVELFQNLFSK